MSKKRSDASAKRSATAIAVRPDCLTDVDLLGPLGPGPVGDREQVRGILAPASRGPGSRQHRPGLPEDRPAAQVG